MTRDLQWWQVLAAVSAAIGALAAAAGAVAAWRSARASERTSRESRRALGAALRPRLKVDTFDLSEDERFAGRSGLAVVVYNPSDWDAADVEIEAVYRDGERIRDSAERVPGHDEEPYAMTLRRGIRGDTCSLILHTSRSGTRTASESPATRAAIPTSTTTRLLDPTPRSSRHGLRSLTRRS
jgi:hypothetical protein